MKIRKRLEKFAICTWFKLKGNGGFGMNELLGIAAALILAAFIIIPGLKTFANSVMSKLTSWWTIDVIDRVFSSSGT